MSDSKLHEIYVEVLPKIIHNQKIIFNVTDRVFKTNLFTNMGKYKCLKIRE